MITKSEATLLVYQELQGSHKLYHSLLAGHIMSKLAEWLGGEPLLWEMTGICHDIDAVRIRGDITLHGSMAVQMLDGLLPFHALKAIAAHDHHTNVKDSSLLALSLRAADLLALIGETLDDEVLNTIAEAAGWAGLEKALGENSGWAEGLKKYAEDNDLALEQLLSALIDRPAFELKS